MAARSAEPWLEDFTLVLTEGYIRIQANDPVRFEVFTGSKPLAAAWASLAGVIGGTFGALMVSGALWSSFLLPPIWLALLVAAWLLMWHVTMALFGRPVRFLAGWCFFWGFLIGLCAMWAAQLDSPGWAYGLAGGLGFIIGITQGVYEQPDMKKLDAWFSLSMLLAPLGAVAPAWCYRNFIGEPQSLTVAGVVGAMAALIFIAPLMAMLAANWENAGGLRRLAALYLHNDASAEKAVAIIDQALKITPADPGLYNLRGFAWAFLGEDTKAEADWQRHLELQPKSAEPRVARGVYLLRRGELEAAIALFEQAVDAKPKHAQANAALGLALHRKGDLEGAIARYERAIDVAPDPLTVTRLAEAHYQAGRLEEALEHCEVAISELDSIHARSWLVRARVNLALGHLEEAEADFRLAFEEDGEEGVDDEARDGLEAMGLQID